ncbi:PX domain-containing protein YPT35 [Trichoderma asperellum]|uniref:Endosomal/vacuolar adapter protein YPT35 n=2 Tax=Trichoderma asperellum TaxID=101201 RepID=A0A6V8QVT8_TRIAP|nr:PX domain-containing protein YPT35 [Trichoderma asperellum]
MASAVDTDQDNAQGDLTSQAGSSPLAESNATPPSNRTLSINTNLPPRDGRSQGESHHGGDNDEALHSALSATSSVTSPPPYWPHVSLHQRNISNMSTESFLPAGAIRLRDNDTSDDDRNSACWAKSVEITDYIFVNGSNTNIGAFIVWNIRVETLNGSFMNIRKRYSEFDDFRRKLTQSFPNFRAAVPELPPKSALFKFRPKFLEKRRAGLQYFLNCILLNPEFSGSPVLKDFLFA